VKVGVLALQGAYRAHALALRRLEVDAIEVRTPEHLAAVDALVIPGGESTTMSHLLRTSTLLPPLAERLLAGLPVLGTCAGMILLATEILDGRDDQVAMGAIDLSVRRNGYGRQRDSFEADLRVAGFATPYPAVFIRAPVVERIGPDVEVLAAIDDRPVLCAQGPVVVTAFHPELTPDTRVHALALERMARG
jgi:5'-phosphate synthase pdxT subunit